MTVRDSYYPSQKKLTFGVEYEFFVHTDALHLTKPWKKYLESLPGTGTPIPEPIALSVADYVKGKLNKLELKHPVEASLRLQAGQSASDNERDYKAWLITTEFTLAPLSQGNSLPHVGMEVVSPAMHNRLDLCGQAGQVAEKLRHTKHVSFSELCGFHVHVGYEKQGFTVQTCKKLFSLLFLGGESILDLLFRADRTNNNEFCLTLEHNCPVRFPNIDFSLTGELPTDWFVRCFPEVPGIPNVDQTKRTALWKIWRAANLKEFCAAAAGGARLAVAFGHLVGGSVAGGSKRTIEFRKGEGDLTKPGNFEFMCVWPQVCMGLVAFGIDASVEDFSRVIRETRTIALGTATNPQKVARFLALFGFDEAVTTILVDRARMLAPPAGNLINF